MPCLCRGLICLIAAVVLGTSSSSVPLLLVSRWHHSRAVVCSCACHHHHRRHLMRFIASHRAPRRRHPAHCVAVAMRPSSPSPCSLVAVALVPSSQLPWSPRHRHPGPLAPSPHVAFGPCASLATLMPVLAVFWTRWSLRAQYIMEISVCPPIQIYYPCSPLLIAILTASQPGT